jgi:hypothetical protein
MGKLVKVHLWTASGKPLLADFEVDETEPYKRKHMGFMSPKEREELRGLSGGSGVLGPLIILENEIESYLFVPEQEESEEEEEDSE